MRCPVSASINLYSFYNTGTPSAADTKRALSLRTIQFALSIEVEDWNLGEFKPDLQHLMLHLY